jgi:hypothetical protein
MNVRASQLRRAVLVSAMTILAGGIAGGAAAQPAMSDIARPAAPTIVGPIPSPVAISARERVAEALASTLDPALPHVAFVDWLFATLAPHLDAPWESRLYWSVRRCSDVLPMWWEGRQDLCVDAGFRLSPDKGVRVIVAAAHQIDPNDDARWRPIPLTVRRAYIDRFEASRVVDSLDVPALRDLAARLAVPDQEWPDVDLIAAVSAGAARPLPGAEVRFAIEVTNRGRRAVQRALVTLVLQRDGAEEIRSDWLRDVGAGQSVLIQFAATLPTGNAIAIVTVKPPQTAETFRGADRRRDPAVAIVGDQGWRRQ